MQDEMVYLWTTYLESGVVVKSKGFEKEGLVKWVNHAKKECAEGILSWEIRNSEGEEE